jgi:hypothetical protein
VVGGDVCVLNVGCRGLLLNFYLKGPIRCAQDSRLYKYWFKLKFGRCL